MESVILTFVGILIGIAATVIVGRHYFLRTVDKRLRVYIHIASPVFGGIDRSVRQVLKAHYCDVEVTDLFQFQFLVANEGERAVRDLIQPLTLSFPNDVKLLDATVLYIHPNGRLVEIASDEITDAGETMAVVRCTFPLLNKGEFFLVKLLLDGIIDPTNLRFRITGDDLPPTIAPEYLPSLFILEESTQNDWFSFFLGIALFIPTLILATSTLALATQAEISGLRNWPVIVSCGLGAVALLILAMILSVFWGLQGTFKQKPRFPLPRDLADHTFGVLAVPNKTAGNSVQK